ncbi:hypothetical protein NQ318_000789 [Aromia moschata]|uniref:Multidrug resistance-associated protein lethal(2)03659 n=1 Tax=Aromia moschata TaxID=1265417 RepID=A0AAV8YS46_9CUCU|nr:hypothetical protein NQ318_000789 [Aromia moschata]
MDESKYSNTNQIKKSHPVERANFISKLFFCWLLPYFVKGYKRDLTEDDLYAPVKDHDSRMLGDKLEKEWNYQVAHKRDPSLLIAIAKVFRRELILSGLFNFFIELIVRLSQPLLISRLLQFYEPNQTSMSQNEAYLLAGLIVVAVLVNVMCVHNYQYHVMHLGMKIRVAACSLIYRKALRLSKSALAETTIGQMVNLLSNDVGRFDFTGQHLHNLWIAPTETLVVMYLVYIYIGPSGLIGTIFLLLFVPFQMYMGKKTSQFRLRTAIRTDERVRLMSEIISGIQVIKMYTWEKPFAKLVEMTRRKEIQQIRATSIIRAIMMSCNMTLNRAAICLCICTYVLTGSTISASYAYTVSSFYGILRNTVTMFFPQAITQLAETLVSIKRIKHFMLYEELDSRQQVSRKIIGDKTMSKYDEHKNGTLPLRFRNNETVGIHLKNASVKWIDSLPENTLENITFNVNSNQLVAIVGPVGGGKSTLLHVILRELLPTEGSVEVEGTISYAPQEPWLFGGSVRQNIIFGQEFNLKKYEEVVRVCALQRDFTLFPHGDRTLVGARGVTLSGGQRARINLARAVYKEADIYLLDDPLSAVDTHVGRQLFDECICGYLKEKCVVLVTHQLQYLRNVNSIYLISGGQIEASGSYSELKNTDSEFTKLLADNKEEEEEKSNTQSNQIDEEATDEQEDVPADNREDRGSGTISSKVYRSYLRAGGSWLKIITLSSAFIIAQIIDSFTDYFLSVWTNVEQWKSENKIINKYNNELTNGTGINNTAIYTNSISRTSLQSYLNEVLTQQVAVTVYIFLVIATIILSVSRSLAFFRFCMTASVTLHNSMFYKIVNASMKFFNTNPPGRILNRFSKDVGSVDEALPLTIVDTVQIGLIVVAISLLIGSLNPWILLPTVIILTIFYYLRHVFLATSRDIKRVEGVTRSPIYTHLTASLQGLTTIRAFEAQEILTMEFDNYQDQYSAAYFMFLGANRTFGFWLDFHCVAYIAFVTVSILFIESEIFGGNVGLALTQAMGLTGMFQWGMRQWSELENQMTSVERIQEYIDIQPELDENTKEPPKFWPENGKLKFDKLCLRYDPSDPYVLKYLSFEIKPQEKVGIVGRTGAGKSSLIVALFRLTQLDGTILIDDVNIKEVPLHILRSKISIIPQEPVLFSGTLRKNLDPFDEYNDEILWNALEEVELKNAVTDLPAGLDSKISEGGSNLSVGQRQLVCLARAIIRNNKILVMDEATANIDPQTDALIQSTIRRKFSDCTVLTIAHRLHTIMDSDKVLVMDAGQVCEFDHPYKLLLNPSGVFHGLVSETGKPMAENLTSIAKLNYENSHE